MPLIISYFLILSFTSPRILYPQENYMMELFMYQVETENVWVFVEQVSHWALGKLASMYETKFLKIAREK